MSAQPQEVTVLDSMPPSQAMTVQDNPYMSMIERVFERGGDLAQLDKLLDLKERWEATEARKAYTAAFAAFKSNPPQVLKDKENKQYGSRYTTLGNMVNTVSAAMGPHGLSASWDVVQAQQIEVTCILTHVMGHSERVTLKGPADKSGAKNDLQQIKSTLTYLKLAAFEAVTGIASEEGSLDDDGNGAGKKSAPIDEKASDWIKQAKQLQGAEDYGPLKSKMLKDYGSVISAIPTSVRDAFSEAKARVMPKDAE